MSFLTGVIAIFFAIWGILFIALAYNSERFRDRAVFAMSASCFSFALLFGFLI